MMMMMTTTRKTRSLTGRILYTSQYTLLTKKIGFLRKTPSGYMVVGLGLVNLTKYFIPESLAESVSKKGIKLKLQPMKHVQSIPM